MSITKKDLIPIYETIKINNKNAVSISVKGGRNTMEDSSFMCELNLPGYYMFAVFDGHCGPTVSYTLKKEFQEFFQDHFLWKTYIKTRHTIVNLPEYWTAVFTKIFLDFDRRLFYMHDVSGSTAVIVLMIPDFYICVTVGDSEAAIIDNNNYTYRISTIHKPDMIEERKRIEDSGSRVIRGRINGDLNLSRSFGDFIDKRMNCPHISPFKYAITVVPSVNIFTRNKKDKHLILGCDGLWDIINDNFTIKDTIISDEKEIERLRHLECESGILEPFVDDVELMKWQCKKMVDFAVEKGSTDNITIILIQL